MITRQLLQSLRPQIETALADIGQRHGIKFALGSARFAVSGANATFKLELAAIDGSGRARTTQATDFEIHARHHGLNPSDLGRRFNYAGEIYTIEGLKPHSPKFPILGKSTVSGKVFKFPANLVAAALMPAA